MVTAGELRELDDEELETRLSEYRRELFNLRFQLATGQLDNVARLAGVRKDVARALTVLRDREIALSEGREPIPPPLSGPAPVRRSRPRQQAAEEEPEALEAEGFEDEEEYLDEDEDVVDEDVDTGDAGEEE